MMDQSPIMNNLLVKILKKSLRNLKGQVSNPDLLIKRVDKNISTTESIHIKELLFNNKTWKFDNFNNLRTGLLDRGDFSNLEELKSQLQIIEKIQQHSNDIGNLIQIYEDMLFKILSSEDNNFINMSFEDDVRTIYHDMHRAPISKAIHEYSYYARKIIMTLCLHFTATRNEVLSRIKEFERMPHKYKDLHNLKNLILLQYITLRINKDKRKKILIVISLPKNNTNLSEERQSSFIKRLGDYKFERIDLDVRFSFKYEIAEFYEELENYDIVLCTGHGSPRSNSNSADNGKNGFAFFDVKNKVNWLTGNNFSSFKNSRTYFLSFLSCATKEFDNLIQENNFEFILTSLRINFQYSEMFYKSFLFSFEKSMDEKTAYDNAMLALLLRYGGTNTFDLYENGLNVIPLKM